MPVRTVASRSGTVAKRTVWNELVGANEWPSHEPTDLCSRLTMATTSFKSQCSGGATCRANDVSSSSPCHRVNPAGTDRHADPHAHTHGDADCHADTHGHTDGDAHCNADRDIDCDTHGHADRDAHGDTDRHPDRDTDRHADQHADTDRYADPHADTDRHADQHTDTDSHSRVGRHQRGSLRSRWS